MSKQEPVDLAKWPIHLRMGEQYVDHLSACDLFLYEEVVWPADQLVWLPIRFQCQTCHGKLVRNHDGHGAPDVDYTTCDTHSATPLMLTAIECVLHAFGAFCFAVDATGTHSDRGCYFREGECVCWCGRRSLLDWASQQAWIVFEGETILHEQLRWQEREWIAPDGQSSIRISFGGAFAVSEPSP